MTSEPVDAAVAQVLNDYPQIAAGYVFGSVARGNATAHSDLDVGVVLTRRGENALDHHRVLADIASRLEHIAPNGRVDVVVLDSQGPIFQHRVLRDGRCVFERDRARRIDFESDAHVRYFDWKPNYELAQRHYRAGLLRWLDTQR